MALGSAPSPVTSAFNWLAVVWSDSRKNLAAVSWCCMKSQVLTRPGWVGKSSGYSGRWGRQVADDDFRACVRTIMRLYMVVVRELYTNCSWRTNKMNEYTNTLELAWADRRRATKRSMESFSRKSTAKIWHRVQIIIQRKITLPWIILADLCIELGCDVRVNILIGCNFEVSVFRHSREHWCAKGQMLMCDVDKHVRVVSFSVRSNAILLQSNPLFRNTLQFFLNSARAPKLRKLNCLLWEANLPTLISPQPQQICALNFFQVKYTFIA